MDRFCDYVNNNLLFADSKWYCSHGVVAIRHLSVTNMYYCRARSTGWYCLISLSMYLR